ncbi:MAG: hypothetical protein PW789_12795 [Edaphobacter sp.]|uniref:hypothetical protein n=1 Tax=Edaphobacter sp. TaxID=1934404 RepID=UPI0023A3D682|nr:hypothetical protein [Edaphobacter sp.]MDE1177461.1 hypothetical protein [Edaphobacter sp.]
MKTRRSWKFFHRPQVSVGTMSYQMNFAASPDQDGLTRRILPLCVALLSIACVAAVIFGARWPLLGDEGIIHYVVFLIEKGHTPYVGIKDLNLPGSYFLDALVIHLLGPGDVGVRLYDLLLCVLACVASACAVQRDKKQMLAGLSAGLLFVLVHLQDGLVEAGQRDFAMAVFAVCAYVILVRDDDRWLQRIFAFSLIVGFTATIKPTLLLLALLPLVYAPSRRFIAWRPLAGVAAMLSGFCLPILIAILWLASHGAVGALYDVLTTIGALHGQLPRRGLWFLLVHSLSPLNEFFLLWLIAVLLGKMRWTAERVALAFCAAAGLVSYLVQGKGLSYHRYPLLFFMLVLMSNDFYRLMQSPGWRRYAGAAAFVAYAFVLAPLSVWRISRFDHAAPFQDALAQRLIGMQASSAEGIQCLDTYVGCSSTLYRLKLEQSTGYLYDCYLTMPVSPLRDRYRREFLQSLTTKRPRTIVVTDQPCFIAHEGFQWMEAWPELASYLGENYRLADQWSSHQQVRLWNRPETPAAFRIYLLKESR